MKYTDSSKLKCCADHFNGEEDIEGWMRLRLLTGPRKSFKLRVKKGVVPHIFPSQEQQERTAGHPLQAGPSKQVSFLRERNDALEHLTKDFSVQVQIKPKLEIQHIELVNIPPKPQKPKILPEPEPETNTPPATKSKRQRKKKVDPLFCYSQDSVASSTPQQDSQRSALSEYEVTHLMEQARNINMIIMSRKPRMYLGVPEGANNIFKLLEKHTRFSQVKIFLSLRRVRLHESYERLGYVFGLHKTTVSMYLNESLPLLGAYLKSFIFWPEGKIIQSNVPNAFRAKYSKVSVIIDCFEVEIEQPTNPLHQALTWSDYKGCNTFKFLLGCTPAGLISFISEGFGGRMSDSVLITESNFLSFLSKGDVVMADRGFKSIDLILRDRGCTLVRPPSVSKGTPMTKDEVRATKMVASLRIHVERVIKRVRDFSFLARHACFHHEACRFVDVTAIIACALCNLQPLIAV